MRALRFISLSDSDYGHCKPFNPSQEVFEQRKAEARNIVHEVKRILWTRFGRKYDVVPFGSTVYLSFGAPMPGGDIDLVILVCCVEIPC